MKAPEDLAGVADMLERQVEFALRNRDKRVFLAIPTFLDFLASDPRLAGLVDDLRHGAMALWDEYERVCGEVLQALREIWKTCEGALGDLHFQGVVLQEDPDFVKFGSELDGPFEIERRYTLEQPTAVHEELSLLTVWVRGARSVKEREPKPSELKHAAES